MSNLIINNRRRPVVSGFLSIGDDDHQMTPTRSGRMGSMAYPSMESPDTRITLRYLASLQCRFSCQHGSYSGIMENLAMDGAYLVSDDSPPEGCYGNLLIEEKDGLKLRLPAKVVHCAESPQIPGFRLAFLIENFSSTLASLACCCK